MTTAFEIRRNFASPTYPMTFEEHFHESLLRFACNILSKNDSRVTYEEKKNILLHKIYDLTLYRQSAQIHFQNLAAFAAIF